MAAALLMAAAAMESTHRAQFALQLAPLLRQTQSAKYYSNFAAGTAVVVKSRV